MKSFLYRKNLCTINMNLSIFTLRALSDLISQTVFKLLNALPSEIMGHLIILNHQTILFS